MVLTLILFKDIPNLQYLLRYTSSFVSDHEERLWMRAFLYLFND